MKLLLDTHVILWWLADDPSLTADARLAIAEPSNIVYISAVSLWEIVIKQGLGKLQLPGNWTDVLDSEPFRKMSITCRHALAVGSLPAIHRDPFDRLLLAQCLDDDLTLVTRDAVMQRYDVSVLVA